MKKILLICCLMVATNMLVLGQATQVSKSDFTAKVNKLTTLLDQNKEDQAKVAWREVHQMMIAEFSLIKSKIRDASGANNSNEATHLSDVNHKQFAIYSDIISLRDNMVQNKATVSKKLSEFAAGIL